MQTKYSIIAMLFVFLIGHTAFSQEVKKTTSKIDQKHTKLVAPKKSLKRTKKSTFGTTITTTNKATTIKTGLQQTITNPVYMLNGKPLADINTINPNDIIAIEVDGNTILITTLATKTNRIKHSLVSN